MKKRFSVLSVGLLFALLTACSEPAGPPGHLLIRNDIQDKEYNKFTVDDVHVKGARSGFRKTLSPGEKVILPKKAVSKLRFTRKYEKFSRVYIVTCPKELNESVTIKLIDVHTGRLNGGCSLVRKGRKVQGTVRWSDSG